MPQISPMKWLVLNMLTQSSIIQISSFLNMMKVNDKNQSLPSYLLCYKTSWSW